MRGLGIVLLVVGAILAFAVNIFVDGANVQLIGFILMGAGVLAVIIGMAQSGSTGSNRITTKRQTSDDGTTVVEEKRID